MKRKICIILTILLFFQIVCDVFRINSENDIAYNPFNIQASAQVNYSFDISFPYLCNIKPRNAHEIESTYWKIGCEVLDRDYANYDSYKPYLGPLGAKRARMQAGWAKTEKQKGIYNWAWLDNIVNDAISQGVTPWLQTSYGNPIYSGGGSSDLGGGFPTSTEALAAWDAWVRALVERYGDRVSEWEVWNEPNLNGKYSAAQYGELYIRTADIILSVQPNAKIAALSLSGFDNNYINSFLQFMKDNGKLDTVHAITVHAYPSNPDSDISDYSKMKNTIRSYSDKIELWQGETGAPSISGSTGAMGSWAGTEIRQAKWDLRRALGALGVGVDAYNFFTLSDYYYPKGLNGKGLISINMDKTVDAPKLSYYSVQNLLSVFDDTIERINNYQYSAETFSESINLFGYQKKDTKKQLVTIWNKGYSPLDSDSLKMMNFVLKNGNFEHPVYINLINGAVYSIPKENWSVSDSTYTFTNIPIFDSPILIADESTFLSYIPEPTEVPTPTPIPTPTPLTSIIDNSDSNCTFDTPWPVTTYTPNYYGLNYASDGNNSGADPSKWAKWTPNISVAGTYKVYMRWPSGTNRPDAAPLEIKYYGGLDTTKTVNQQNNNATWVLIGTYDLSAGTDNYVKLIASDAGATIADAVKFELVSPPTQTPSPMEALSLKIEEAQAKYDTIVNNNSIGTGSGQYDPALVTALIAAIGHAKDVVAIQNVTDDVLIAELISLQTAIDSCIAYPTTTPSPTATLSPTLTPTPTPIPTPTPTPTITESPSPKPDEYVLDSNLTNYASVQAIKNDGWNFSNDYVSVSSAGLQVGNGSTKGSEGIKTFAPITIRGKEGMPCVLGSNAKVVITIMGINMNTEISPTNHPFISIKGTDSTNGTGDVVAISRHILSSTNKPFCYGTKGTIATLGISGSGQKLTPDQNPGINNYKFEILVSDSNGSYLNKPTVNIFTNDVIKLSGVDVLSDVIQIDSVYFRSFDSTANTKTISKGIQIKVVADSISIPTPTIEPTIEPTPVPPTEEPTAPPTPTVVPDFVTSNDGNVVVDQINKKIKYYHYKKDNINYFQLSVIKSKLEAATGYTYDIYQIDEITLATGTNMEPMYKVVVTSNGTKVATYTFVATMLYGDIDGSGTIVGSDLIWLRKYIIKSAQYPLPKPYSMRAADINKSSGVNGSDLLLLRKYIISSSKYSITGATEFIYDPVLEPYFFEL